MSDVEQIRETPTSDDNEIQIPSKLIDRELLAYAIHGVSSVLSEMIHEL